MYTNRIMNYYYPYCAPLSQNITVKVSETRNDYIRKYATWNQFSVGTFIDVIASFLGKPSSVAEIVLNSIGVALDIYDCITNIANLCNGAEYWYKGTRRGSVYDFTVVHGYALVIRYVGTGKFEGGYLNTGEFNWVEQKSSAYNHPYSSIGSTAGTNYSNDLAANNNLCTYSAEYALYPD